MTEGGFRDIATCCIIGCGCFSRHLAASTWLSSLDNTWEKFFSDDCDGPSSQSSLKKCCFRRLLPMTELSHAGAPLLWPGGASVASFAAELLAGPMWGGREGGPGCPSGQPGKRPRRSKRNAISQHTACSTTQHATAFFFATASTVCPVEPWVRQVARVRSDVRVEAILTADLAQATG